MSVSKLLGCFCAPVDPSDLLAKATEYAVNKGNPAQARRCYQLAAELGNTEAQYHLGWMCQEGNGGRLDLLASIKWWGKAAENGHVAAQFALAKLLIAGREGVPKDTERANQVFAKLGIGIVFKTSKIEG